MARRRAEARARVFTYPPDLGFDELSFASTAGAFVLAAGIAVFAWDVLRPKSKEPRSPRNPWKGGTLEWLAEMSGRKWGIRSIPEIDSRYPLWDQPSFERDVDEGRFYLPDAEEGLRETLVTTVIDAQPVQCLRLPGPTFLTLWAALFIGGVFIFSTFHWWWPAAISGALGLAAIFRWLWTGTAFIPEKKEKDVGLGLKLPLYRSGSASVGWWAMFITMLGISAAFISLVFGYFFYWTIHEDFPPKSGPQLGIFWPVFGCGLLLAAWALTLLARHFNKRELGGAFFASLAAAVPTSIAGGAALIAGPWTAGLDPATHVYPAIVWALVIWTALYVAAGVFMLLYCAARRAAKRLTAEHDIDISNVALFWHFVAVTTVITVAVIAGFPRLT